MKNTMKHAFVGAVFTAAASFAVAEDKPVAEAQQCSAAYAEATTVIAAEPTQVLELVAKLVAANESCAADVVKAAIKATNAKPEMVAQIVEVASTAAPKQLTQIATAATAVAPDASKNIAAVVAKISAEQGTARGGVVEPLDLPRGVNPNNPGPGGSNHPVVGNPAGGVPGGGIAGPSGTPNTETDATGPLQGASR